MSSDEPSKLERLAKSDVGEGFKHAGKGILSVFGNAIHALGSLIHGTGRGVRGAGHWAGKGVEHGGHIAGKAVYAAGKLANYLADRVARVDPEEKDYIEIPRKDYDKLLKSVPEEQKILSRYIHLHHGQIRIPRDEASDLLRYLQAYTHRGRPRYGFGATVLLLAALALANVGVTGAAVGVGVSASLSTFLSLLLLFIAILLFSRR